MCRKLFDKPEIKRTCDHDNNVSVLINPAQTRRIFNLQLSIGHGRSNSTRAHGRVIGEQRPGTAARRLDDFDLVEHLDGDERAARRAAPGTRPR
jgi:hypothetical protein